MMNLKLSQSEKQRETLFPIELAVLPLPEFAACRQHVAAEFVAELSRPVSKTNHTCDIYDSSLLQICNLYIARLHTCLLILATNLQHAVDILQICFM